MDILLDEALRNALLAYEYMPTAYSYIALKALERLAEKLREEKTPAP